MKQIVTLCVALAALALGGCETAKDAVAKKVADVGNRYCEARDPELRDAAVNSANEELRENGARWTFDGITCD